MQKRSFHELDQGIINLTEIKPAERYKYETYLKYLSKLKARTKLLDINSYTLDIEEELKLNNSENLFKQRPEISTLQSQAGKIEIALSFESLAQIARGNPAGFTVLFPEDFTHFIRVNSLPLEFYLYDQLILDNPEIPENRIEKKLYEYLGFLYKANQHGKGRIYQDGDLARDGAQLLEYLEFYKFIRPLGSINSVKAYPIHSFLVFLYVFYTEKRYHRGLTRKRKRAGWLWSKDPKAVLARATMARGVIRLNILAISLLLKSVKYQPIDNSISEGFNSIYAPYLSGEYLGSSSESEIALKTFYQNLK